MSFATLASKSVNKAVVLFELDILHKNIQWVNIGAGIWEVNFDGLYPFVDSSLLDGFTSQAFFPVGSVMVDGGFQTKVSTLALVTTTEESYYYDSDSKTLYLHVVNNDEPFIHNIFIGVTNGFSHGGFTPIDSDISYEGRLISAPTIGKERDPLFFGKLAFPNANFQLINADGYFDTFGEDNNIYGNPGRLKIGFKDLSIDEYITIFTGYIENSSVGEETFSISLNDKRKQLSKEITYTCTNKNALDAIVEILLDAYNIQYTAAYYDITAWNSATLLAPNVTINETDPIKVIEIIEKICVSCFGIFDVNNDGLFSFNYIGDSATAATTIYKSDLMEMISINYDPSEVISSVRVGYSYNESTSDYSWFTDDTRKAAIFEKYKTYNQQSFETYLDTASSATVLASTILDYFQDVHGIIENQIPLMYYALEVGDNVTAELNRVIHTMLGSKDCEILGLSFINDFVSILIKLRIN